MAVHDSPMAVPWQCHIGALQPMTGPWYSSTTEPTGSPWQGNGSAMNAQTLQGHEEVDHFLGDAKNKKLDYEFVLSGERYTEIGYILSHDQGFLVSQ